MYEKVFQPQKHALKELKPGRLGIEINQIVTDTFLSAGYSVQEYTQAIEASPDDMKYKFYLLRGKAYKDSGEMSFALKDLNTSIMLNPGMTAYKYRGEVYFEMERYGDAINDFTTALEFNPTIELYKKRLESYLKSINYVLALADGTAFFGQGFGMQNRIC